MSYKWNLFFYFCELGELVDIRTELERQWPRCKHSFKNFSLHDAVIEEHPISL